MKKAGGFTGLFACFGMASAQRAPIVLRAIFATNGIIPV